jgi:hypothetical protein
MSGELGEISSVKNNIPFSVILDADHRVIEALNLLRRLSIDTLSHVSVDMMSDTTTIVF